MKSFEFTGAGDVVQAVAKVTGIEAVVKTVEKVTGKDCGCDKRREALNKAIPFKEGSD
tara:strand:+ start:1167 stop:1340 length:174 start_codon:yes stop_codon:yes gene_type:complete